MFFYMFDYKSASPLDSDFAFGPTWLHASPYRSSEPEYVETTCSLVSAAGGSFVCVVARAAGDEKPAYSIIE